MLHVSIGLAPGKLERVGRVVFRVKRSGPGLFLCDLVLVGVRPLGAVALRERDVIVSDYGVAGVFPIFCAKRSLFAGTCVSRSARI